MAIVNGAQINALVTTWPTMEPAIDEVLEQYEARQATEDTLVKDLTTEEMGRRRDEFLVSVGRATGVLLNLLVRETRAHSILEIGTGSGYSTIWLAEGARATGGKVVSIDLVSSKQEYARSALERAGLSQYVHFHLGDAVDFLTVTRDVYDFVLLDAWKDHYIRCVDALLGRLNLGATIIADNMLKPASVRLAGARYLAHVRGISTFQTALLPVGSGLALSRYQGG